ncbi:aspartate 1-decarboxylase [Candidatus Auribacterota bacterium]
MLISVLKSKLHRARVTDSHLDYNGSITIDEDLMKKANIVEYEKVLVANLSNGERFETYAIKGKSGSKTICLNGATSHLGKIGDRVIILTFVNAAQKELEGYKPTVIRLNEKNDIEG